MSDTTEWIPAEPVPPEEDPEYALRQRILEFGTPVMSVYTDDRNGYDYTDHVLLYDRKFYCIQPECELGGPFDSLDEAAGHINGNVDQVGPTHVEIWEAGRGITFRHAPDVVLHIPHASTKVPASVRRTLLLSDRALKTELLRMTDHHTDALFALDERDAEAVVYDVSRLVVDPERFTEDAAEKMSACGMGVVYTRTSHGKPLRESPRPAQRLRLLDKYYHPHHERLTQTVARSLAQHRRCLVLDCHSFPAQPLPYELDKASKRLDICLGTDAFHTPPKLLAKATEAFRAEGFTVSVNRPFSGALVPGTWYGKDARVEALMVEVNRGLYMNEKTGKRLPEFNRLRTRVVRAMESVAKWWR